MDQTPNQLKRPKLPQWLPRYLKAPDLRRLLTAALTNIHSARGPRNWPLLALLYDSGPRHRGWLTGYPRRGLSFVNNRTQAATK